VEELSETVRFEVLMALTLMTAVFLDVIPWTWCLHLQGRRVEGEQGEFFYSEDRSSRFHWNIGNILPDSTMSHPRTLIFQKQISSKAWERNLKACINSKSEYSKMTALTIGYQLTICQTCCSEFVTLDVHRVSLSACNTVIHLKVWYTYPYTVMYFIIISNDYMENCRYSRLDTMLSKSSCILLIILTMYNLNHDQKATPAYVSNMCIRTHNKDPFSWKLMVSSVSSCCPVATEHSIWRTENHETTIKSLPEHNKILYNSCK
jgi:hypothetical protein